MGYKKGAGPDANYNFRVQKQPKVRMGEGDFANMPGKPMIRGFVPEQEYRDGIINGFTTGVDFLSGIDENRC